MRSPHEHDTGRAGTDRTEASVYLGIYESLFGGQHSNLMTFINGAVWYLFKDQPSERVTNPHNLPVLLHS